MRRLHIDDIRPGMKAARTVFDTGARVLIKTGTTITEPLISRLRELGIEQIYVENEEADHEGQTTKKGGVSLHRAATYRVRQTLTSLNVTHRLDIGGMRERIDSLMLSCLDNEAVLMNLEDVRRFDGYTFSHSIDVCVLSLMSGISVGMSDEELLELGMGALLHDVGKIAVDRTILNKKEPLTEAEFALIKEHTRHGFKLLSGQPGIPETAAVIAYQHHEKWNGQGYPQGLKGPEIHPYALIVEAADVYDALLADRPYRPGYSVPQAVRILLSSIGSQLELTATNALLAHVKI